MRSWHATVAHVVYAGWPYLVEIRAASPDFVHQTARGCPKFGVFRGTSLSKLLPSTLAVLGVETRLLGSPALHSAARLKGMVGDDVCSSC